MPNEKRVIFEIQQACFYIDETVPCLVNEWRGFISSQDFRAAIIKLVELLKEFRPQYSCLNLLADTRTMGVLNRADVEWVASEINPQYLAAGASHEAFVLSKDEFGKLSVKRYITNTVQQGEFIVQMFDSVESAKEWLRESCSQSGSMPFQVDFSMLGKPPCP